MSKQFYFKQFRLFSVISRTLVGGAVLPLCRHAVSAFYSPVDWANPKIGSFKTAIEEEQNKMSEEFILKACESFQRRVDTIIEKNGSHIE